MGEFFNFGPFLIIYFMEHFSKIVDYNSFGYKKTQKEIIDVVRYEDSNDLKMSCSGLTSDFIIDCLSRICPI
jgi:hypothetical protein